MHCGTHSSLKRQNDTAHCTKRHVLHQVNLATVSAIGSMPRAKYLVPMLCYLTSLIWSITRWRLARRVNGNLAGRGWSDGLEGHIRCICGHCTEPSTACSREHRPAAHTHMPRAGTHWLAADVGSTAIWQAEGGVMV